MNRNAIAPALLFALLSSTALAGELTIDLNQAVQTDWVVDSPGSSNGPIIDVKINRDTVESLVGSAADPALDAPLNLGDVDAANHTRGGNVIEAVAGANVLKDSANEYAGNNSNWQIFEENGSLAEAEALIASVNLNSAAVTANVDDVDLSTTAGDVTGSELGFQNNSVSALSVINGQENNIVGDASSRTESADVTTPGGSFDFTDHTTTPTATIGGVAAEGDIVIAAYQRNSDTGDSSAAIQNIDGTTDITSLDATSTIGSQGNEFVAESQVNYLGNTVNLEHLGTDLDIVVASLQENEATATATIAEVDISLDASNSVLGSMSVSENEFAALATVNNMSNIIASESGSADGNIYASLGQNNIAAVTTDINNLDLSLSGGDTNADTIAGDLAIRNNEITAGSYVNRASNSVSSDSSGAGIVDFYQLQQNVASVTNTISDVDMSTSSDTDLDGSMSVDNNEITAFAYVNLMSNTYTSESSGTGDVTVDLDQINEGVVTSTVTGVDMSHGADDALTGDMSAKNNDITALAAVNVISNLFTNESGGTGPIDLDVSQITNINAAVTSTVTDVDMSREADTGVMSGGMEVAHNAFAATAYANVMNNTITNNGSGERDVTANLIQTNNAAISAIATELDMSLSADAAATAITGDMSTMNNTVTANAFANSMYNDITYGNSGTSNNRLFAMQENTAAISATINNLTMGGDVAGMATGSSVGISNNRISATALVNSATNIIRLR